MNNRGMSEVIATVLMIALTLMVFLIVFSITNNLISDEVESSEACFGNYGKVTIDNSYTCYNTTTNEIQFLIAVGDLEIDGVLASVSGDVGTESFEIKNNSLSFVREYGGNYNSPLEVPGKNSGKTYFVDFGSLNLGNVKGITIAPIIKGKQCEISDSLDQISDCRLFS